MKRLDDIVHVCRHLGRRSDGAQGHCETDLVFTDEGPLLVFEWAELPSGESVPSVGLLVAADRLHAIDWPGCKYMLEGEAVPIPDGIAEFN